MAQEANNAGTTPPRWPPARAQKFRQAAFVYLHVAILYEATMWIMMSRDMAPDRFGPAGVWLVLGAAVGLGVAAGLYWWQNAWFARIIWLVHAGRLPWIIGGAFFPTDRTSLPPAFYVTALVVVVGNLWMLARAGWDL